MKTQSLTLFAGTCLGVAACVISTAVIRFTTGKPPAENAKESNPPENNRYTIENAGFLPRGSSVVFLTDNLTGERWVVVNGRYGGEPAIASANMKKETK